MKKYLKLSNINNLEQAVDNYHLQIISNNIPDQCANLVIIIRYFYNSIIDIFIAHDIGELKVDAEKFKHCYQIIAKELINNKIKFDNNSGVIVNAITLVNIYLSLIKIKLQQLSLNYSNHPSLNYQMTIF